MVVGLWPLSGLVVNLGNESVKQKGHPGPLTDYHPCPHFTGSKPSYCGSAFQITGFPFVGRGGSAGGCACACCCG